MNEEEQEKTVIKKCEICGSCYEPYNVKQDKENTNGYMFVNVNTNESYYMGDIKTCCPTCMTTIRRFIKTIQEHSKKTED